MDKSKVERGIITIIELILITMLLMVLASTSKANAQVVNGSQALAGYSKDLHDFYESGGQFYTEEELNLLAEVMFHENGSNSDLCILYTGSVVLNRVKHKDFPDTIRDVLFQKGQYSTTNLFFTKSIPNHIYDLAKELLIFGSQLEDDYVFQAMFIQSAHYIKVDTEYFCKR